MITGGMNIIREKAGKRFKIAEGMGNFGFDDYVCKVTLEAGGRKVLIGSDVLIAVSRQNEIARRMVAKPKMRGTIKESWAVGDWEVNLSGVIISENKDDFERMVKELTEICEVRESVSVTCDALNALYDITKIAIRGIQLPFTPGVGNQQFNISAYSDESYELLEEL